MPIIPNPLWAVWRSRLRSSFFCLHAKSHDLICFKVIRCEFIITGFSSTRAGRVFHCHLPIGMQIWRRVGWDVWQHISRSWTCKGAFDIWELMKSIWHLYIYMTFTYTYILQYIDMHLLLLSALAPPFSQISCWFPFFLSTNKTILQLQPPQLPTNQPSLETFNDFVLWGQWPQMGEGSLGRCQFVHAPRGSLGRSTLWQLDGCWSRAGVGIHEGGRSQSLTESWPFWLFFWGRGRNNKKMCVFCWHPPPFFVCVGGWLRREEDVLKKWLGSWITWRRNEKVS